MSRLDVKKKLLEIFTQKQPEVEAELKTSILSSDEHYYLGMMYAIAQTDDFVRGLMEPWIRGIAASSRGLGGKGSEQLINLLYPGRYQQYLFPYPIFTPQQQQQAEQQPQQLQQQETRKKRFFII